MNDSDTDTRLKRIAAARAELARRYAEDPDAVQRFEAKKARLAAAAKRERAGSTGRDGRPNDPDMSRPAGMSRQDWKIERNRRQNDHRRAIAEWNRRARIGDLNGPTPELASKAPYVEMTIYDNINGRRIRIGHAFRRQARFEMIDGLSAEQISALRRYRKTFDTSELSTMKSGLDIGVGGGMGGREAVISRLQAVVFADIALNKIEDAVPRRLVQTLRRIALHDDDFKAVALARFGSSSGQRRSRVRAEFIEAVDALVVAMRPPARVLVETAAQGSSEGEAKDQRAVPPAFFDERGYMLPWGDIIDVITAGLRDEEDECEI